MRSKSHPPRRATRPVRLSLAVAALEALEDRKLLSASLTIAKTATPIKSVLATPSILKPIAQPHYKKSRPATTHRNASGVVVPYYSGINYPYGKTPTQVRSAYGLGAYGSSPITFNGIQGDGAGQTIAIVDAYDFPTAFNDLNAFSTQFGLPTLTSNTASLSAINSSSGPTFTKIGQTGNFTNLPGTDPAGPYSTTQGSDWEQEAALDIEWAHVMAPKANIVLVEATTSGSLLPTAVAYARTIPGVVDVSMSFGGGEYSSETTYDQYFTTTSGHLGGAAAAGGTLLSGGVTFLASTGDSGAYQAFGSSTIAPEYPSTSPNVVAVGGTTLNTSGNSYVSESGWGAGTSSNSSGGGGGGISAYETIPTYQSGTNGAYSTSKRTVPDLSILADPNTGVPIYDSYDYGTSTPWIPGSEGGTSLACPMMAGIVAVADQGRAINGLGSLYGNQAGAGTAAGALQNIYSISSADYHDITSGSNGPSPTYAAAAGYDLVTGRGSPIAGSFVKDVAALPANTGTVAGTVFSDNNGDGVFNGNDTALVGVTVYADNDNSGTLTSGDTSTTSTAGGAFALSGLAAGKTIREIVPGGYVSTTGAAGGTTTTGSVTGVALGNFPTTFAAAAGTNTFTLRLDGTGTKEQIFQNTATSATPTYTVARSLLTGLAFTGNTGDDTFVLDLTNGNPLLGGGVTFAGAGQGTADTLKVQAAAAGSTVGFTGSVSFVGGTVTVGGLSLVGSSVEALAYAGGVGSDNVTLTTPGGATVPPLDFVGGGGSDALTVSGGVFVPAADLGADGSSVTLSLNSAAAATFATSQHLAALSLGGGANARFTTAGTVLRTSGLSIDTASNAYLDLNASGLVYDYSATTPATVVNALLASGYAAGAWNGLGIRSAAAAADATKGHALGNGEAATALKLTGATTGTFLGETVDATTYLVRYTLYGDSNLSGNVDFSDFLVLQNNYGTTTNSFAQGNYNYDTTTDFSDFLKLQNQYGLTA